MPDLPRYPEYPPANPVEGVSQVPLAEVSPQPSPVASEKKDEIQPDISVESLLPAPGSDSTSAELPLAGLPSNAGEKDEVDPATIPLPNNYAPELDVESLTAILYGPDAKDSPK